MNIWPSGKVTITLWYHIIQILYSYFRKQMKYLFDDRESAFLSDYKIIKKASMTENLKFVLYKSPSILNTFYKFYQQKSYVW